MVRINLSTLALLFIFLLTFIPTNNAIAQSIECPALKQNSTNQFKLETESNLQNCFYTDDHTRNSPLEFILISAIDNDANFDVDIYASVNSVVTRIHTLSRKNIDTVQELTANQQHQKLYYRIRPSSNHNTTKRVHILHHVWEGKSRILISYSEEYLTTYENPITGPGGSDGGYCKRSVCFDPLGNSTDLYKSNISKKSQSKNQESYYYFNNLNEKCSSENTMPDGAPEGYDLNEVLRRAHLFSQHFPGMSGKLYRSYVFASLSADNGPWDIKRHPTNPSTEEYGNAHYGAIGSALGFNSMDLHHASSAYQAITNGEGKFQFIYNLMTNTGDGPGDQVAIAKGIAYFHEVFSKNPNDDQRDSCNDENSESSSDAGAGGSTSNAGSWGAGGIWISGSGCIGSCSIPPSNIEITDLPTKEK